MKTLQELYEEVVADDEQKKAFVQALKDGALGDSLAGRGCEATGEEVQEFLEAKAHGDVPAELSEDELVRVAGGSMLSVTCACTGDTCGCSGTCIRECC